MEENIMSIRQHLIVLEGAINAHIAEGIDDGTRYAIYLTVPQLRVLIKVITAYMRPR